MKKLPRVYRQWTEWEEIEHNMWGAVNDRERAVAEAVTFTGDHALYGSYMRRVIVEWPVSCENALTDYSLNRRAWLGHAACALAHRWPEDVVREAWSHLSNERQFLANQQAAGAIQTWENNYRTSLGLRRHVGEQMLLVWPTRSGAR